MPSPIRGELNLRGCPGFGGKYTSLAREMIISKAKVSLLFYFKI